MTADQTAINSRTLIAAAAKLERIGYDGDAYRFVESLVLSVLADGYRKVTPPPPLRGPGAGRDAIEAAKEAARAAVQKAREARTTGTGAEG